MRSLTFLFRVSIAFLAFNAIGYCLPLDNAQQDMAAMKSMTLAQLEKAGDDCRAHKDYQQAVKYFSVALEQDKKNGKIYNKRGLAELSAGDYASARSDFAKTTKYDRKYADGWNNLGAIYYVEKNYRVAAKYFQKAISLDENRAPFHVNLGVTWFTLDDLDRAMQEYTRAAELDPDALMRSSNFGVTAQLTTQQERAEHQYMIAKVFAKLGNVDDCLVCLKKAKEEGYGGLNNVYKEEEFTRVRQDARLAEIVPPPAAK